MTTYELAWTSKGVLYGDEDWQTYEAESVEDAVRQYATDHADRVGGEIGEYCYVLVKGHGAFRYGVSAIVTYDIDVGEWESWADVVAFHKQRERGE